MNDTNVEWSASRPGMWRADRGHSTTAMTPIAQHIFTNTQPAALRELFAQWGVVADTLDVEFINGHYFTRLRPLVGADKPQRRQPPAAVLRVMTRVHPEMRRRNRQAARTLRTRPWLATIAEWSTTTRPEWERRNLALQDVDLQQLDDRGLANHVESVVEHAVTALHTHFVLHGSDLGPIGLLIVFCEQRGIPIDQVVRALQGASPSSSEPARLLAEIHELVTESGTNPATLDELRSITPLIDDYLRLRGARIISGYDIASMTLGEAPTVVMATVLHARQSGDVATGEQAESELRSAVPTTDTSEFDQLLAEARSCMDMRDDNGPYLVEWPFGLVRLTVLEAGRRLVSSGSLTQPEHALELTHHEIAALLRGLTADPGAAAVSARAADRQRRSLMIPPDIVGDPEPPPPVGVLPAPAEQLVAMIGAILGKLERVEHVDQLMGTGVGDCAYVGVVRRADTPDAAIAALQAGEVLVVPFTTPMYNAVLPLAGALVTAAGGPLSHAAVLARELGIPAVIGAKGALDLRDGTTVRVDPANNTIVTLDN